MKLHVFIESDELHVKKLYLETFEKNLSYWRLRNKFIFLLDFPRVRINFVKFQLN